MVNKEKRNTTYEKRNNNMNQKRKESYIAFLDILGFKKKLEKMNQETAQEYIMGFSSVIYNIFKAPRATSSISGYIVSDSVILYSSDVSKQSLNELVSLVKSICKREFEENNILIRGAISKGEFVKMNASVLRRLDKGLMVGQGYVDAYLLEDSLKIAGIILSEAVYQDIKDNTLEVHCIKLQSKNREKIFFNYFDYDFLNKKGNLEKFVQLARKSKWLPHYYNTLYFAIKDKDSDEVYRFLDSLITSVRKEKGKIEIFIENAFDKDVNIDFRREFATYIKEHFLH